jgi:hypothetical protein
MTYQPMTKEVRTLIAGLVCAYGEDSQGRPMASLEEAQCVCFEAEIAALQEYHTHAGSSTYGPREVHVAQGNNYCGYEWQRQIHVFHFGAYGCTHVLAFGSLEDALEDAASVLKKVAPGCFTEPEYPDGVEYDPSGEDDEANRLIEEAEEDLTYTESGYIASWEWTATSFDTLADVAEWAANG